MTKIRPIYDEKILPDGSKTPFYPLTSAKAVYTNTNINIQHLLNEGYRFGGIVTPTDYPEFTDQRVYYGANTEGTYNNFGGFTVKKGEAVFFMYDGSNWSMAPFSSSDISGEIIEKLEKAFRQFSQVVGEQIGALEDRIDDMAEDIEAFKAEITQALEDNERVIANALVRHEQQLGDSQDTQIVA